MAVQEKTQEETIELLNTTHEVYTNEINGIVENSRWLTTLVLAEVAGIASYRQMIDSNSLSLPFTIAVLILIASLLAFILSVMLARSERSFLILEIDKVKEELRNLIHADDISANEGSDKIIKRRSETTDQLSMKLRMSSSLETVGLICMLIASIIASLSLFSNELKALFS